MTLEPFVPAAKSAGFPETQVPARGAGVCRHCPGRCPRTVPAPGYREPFSWYFPPLSSRKQLANPGLQKNLLDGKAAAPLNLQEFYLKKTLL